MRLVFSGNTAWSMYNFRRNILVECVSKGYEIYVLAPEDSMYEQLITGLGCKFIPIVLERKGKNPIKEVSLYLQYKRILKAIRPDGCFFYTIKPNIYGSFAAASLGIPYVPVTTGLGYIFNVDNLLNKIVKFLYKKAFRKACQVWFLNNDDLASFVDEKIIPFEKAKVLKGEGIDVEHFEVHADMVQQPVFLLLARMLWDKGVGIYVEAAKIIKEKYPQARFQLLGAVDDENPMGISLTQLEDWNKKGYVEYLGVTDDVRPYIYQSSCVVLPSYYREGIPFCLMEGAAAGKPLITTINTGCREVVEDGYNGFLCKTKDVDSLVEAMDRFLLLDAHERTQMGLNGRQKMMREFGIDVIKDVYAEAIDSFFKK